MLRRHARAGATLAFVASTALPLPPRLEAAQAPATDTSLELLAENATRAVVLIDVRTSADARQGSGFIVAADGLILTNYHVMRDARSARVKLASGDVYDRVTILAQDERRDMAVLRIAGFNLPTLPLGNSDSVRIGSPIMLIGSPLGLENTVSSGIVSGRRQEPEGFQLLQITAPASQGSSGGAVIGGGGSVVGIAVSQLLAGQNLNFAVPINYARGLLENLDGAPVAVLESTTSGGSEGQAARPMTGGESVNRGLVFDPSALGGLVIESLVDLGDEQQRQTRITYRVIETVGGGPDRIERYLESETTRARPPFGTHETLRRERARALVTVDGLRPLSSRGEVAFLSDGGWREASHEVQFESERVVGVVTDTAGRSIEIDRVLPRGILLRDVRDLAFALLAEDSLVGRSVELDTFEPRTGEVTSDRYDVLAVDTLEVLGTPSPVLRVNVASGLVNEVVYFTQLVPRVAIRRVSPDGARVERTTRLERLDRRRPER